jgi:hypothetical protein
LVARLIANYLGGVMTADKPDIPPEEIEPPAAPTNNPWAWKPNRGPGSSLGFKTQKPGVMSMRPRNYPRNHATHTRTVGASSIGRPYFRHLDPNAVFQPRRMGPYFPGTGPVRNVDSDRYDIAENADEFDWGSTNVAEDEVSTDDYRNTTPADFMIQMASSMNQALGRINHMDRDRRAHNPRRFTYTWPIASNTETITTELPYTSQPFMGMSFDWNAGHHYNSAAAQNANGTWDIEVTVENAPAGVPGTVVGNAKGPVADTTDLE